MFGTMGISELIIILVIVLIIFGAGRLPSIGEGVGKALKGFKKEVNEIPPPPAEVVQPQPEVSAAVEAPQVDRVAPQTTASVQPVTKATNVPYVPGPELTPGTTASMMYNMGPQSPQAPRQAASSQAQTSGGQQALSMEERAAAPAPARSPAGRYAAAPRTPTSPRRLARCNRSAPCGCAPRSATAARR